MGRKPDPRRKAELLSAFADYLLAHGLAGFSLRPAARAVRTSPRMLLYHFGSKERLIAEALAEIRSRQAGVLAEMAGGEPRRKATKSVEGDLWRLWNWYASPHMDAFLRLFFEVWGLALRDPEAYGGFLESARTDLRSLLEGGLRAAGHPRKESRVLATMYIGAFRGLLLDLLTSGERDRIDAAVALLSRELQEALAGLSEGPRPARRGRRHDTGK